MAAHLGATVKCVRGCPPPCQYSYHHQPAHKDRDPRWKTYKNRKKTLRQDVKAGRISQAERTELQAAAYREYLTGEVYLDGHSAPLVLASPDAMLAGCNRQCWSASKPQCRCPCLGANHGAKDGGFDEVLVLCQKQSCRREAVDGWCADHVPPQPTCDLCDLPYYSGGFCKRHWWAQMRTASHV